MMIKRILVAVDFSPVTRRVIAVACEQARLSKAKVLLMHVEPPGPDDFVSYKAGPKTVRQSVSQEIRSDHKKLRALEKQLQDKGIPVTALLLRGPTAAKILKEARQFSANLIVMGTHGRNPLKELLLGSVSKGVLAKTPCPVLLVKSTT